MPSQEYAIYVLGSLQESFSLRDQAHNNFLCHVLLYVMMFAFCSQVPMWLPC